MYGFFRLAGREDSVALAERLVSEAALGLAPGAGFGGGGEGQLRWCFAAPTAKLDQGLDQGFDRLGAFLAATGGAP